MRTMLQNLQIMYNAIIMFSQQQKKYDIQIQRYIIAITELQDLKSEAFGFTLFQSITLNLTKHNVSYAFLQNKA